MGIEKIFRDHLNSKILPIFGNGNVSQRTATGRVAVREAIHAVEGECSRDIGEGKKPVKVKMTNADK